ncbi:MAG: hypothetical protein ACJ8LG_06480 [Massilia sp.]
MARSDSISAPSLKAVQSGQDPRPFHQPFCWLNSGLRNDPQARFAALTMDVSNGVQTCLQLIHRDMMTRDNNRLAAPGQEVAPVLDEAAGERLLLLATAAVQLLSARAEDHIDAMHTRAESQATSGVQS